MNMLLFILCLVSQSPDTLWTVDFSSQPAGWIAGSYWEYTVESIYLFLSCIGGSGPSYKFYTDNLFSPDFVVPLTADSLVLVFDHFWNGQGYTFWPEEWARTIASLDMYNYCNPPYPIELWEIAHWCGSPPPNSNSDKLLYTSDGYNSTDSGSVFIPLIGVSAGDTLSFEFTGLVEIYWIQNNIWAEIDWDICTFSILDYPSVSLERSTWGMIKSSF